MTVTIRYGDGTSVSLHSVETVTTKGPSAIELQTYGNLPTLHRNVVCMTVSEERRP